MLALHLRYSPLRRHWVPIVIAAALILGGFTIDRLHSVFGSANNATTTRLSADQIHSTNLKHVTYEILGPAQTQGTISYLDEYAQPRETRFDLLPWSFSFTTTSASVLANIIAEGDNSRLGCRILVDGVVRDAQVFEDHYAMAFCSVKAA